MCTRRIKYLDEEQFSAGSDDRRSGEVYIWRTRVEWSARAGFALLAGEEPRSVERARRTYGNPGCGGGLRRAISSASERGCEAPWTHGRPSLGDRVLSPAAYSYDASATRRRVSSVWGIIGPGVAVILAFPRVGSPTSSWTTWDSMRMDLMEWGGAAAGADWENVRCMGKSAYHHTGLEAAIDREGRHRRSCVEGGFIVETGDGARAAREHCAIGKGKKTIVAPHRLRTRGNVGGPGDCPTAKEGAESGAASASVDMAIWRRANGVRDIAVWIVMDPMGAWDGASDGAPPISEDSDFEFASQKSVIENGPHGRVLSGCSGVDEASGVEIIALGRSSVFLILLVARAKASDSEGRVGTFGRAFKQDIEVGTHFDRCSVFT
ncbi:hypothetical protein B0H17DRAFT_1125741 [Mycena rosella]|uniref:Uncharacterized protein n=1 Tax=Mycena rosella TaxID=1033263 RepID=A0AAD7GWT5_MYCRO|nr:hypothetical protein B0H17DRAFT_1125741 [Mycena rosella]